MNPFSDLDDATSVYSFPGKGRHVLDALTGYIKRHNLRPGDRLPTEREFSMVLKIARSSIREAFSQLSALGIIESRAGSGTYLLRHVSPDTIYMPLSLSVDNLAEMLLMTLEVRRGIEIEASMAAARRRTQSDITRMRAALEAIERTHHSEEGSGPADFAFHMAIYDAAHNPLFRQLLEQMRDRFGRFWERPFGRHDFASRSFPFHRTLFDAIVAGDAEAAAAETRKILDVVEEDIRDMGP
ncbi:FadR/GntR family transcriptional regulator [Paracoccus aerodenitrificans]|uniref:FadR/GntR family transcriptional regulator n=1 Tax=Paracoccus aerodenitrificans TaxID=3017781 RepID=UPI0022F086A0|nr:FadR/GntR family transcriptional regulator [Paracoccus aerodenitrificans]WBU63928.1 FadR/GntR family transcriptional regulator [Paracoccus aerodenitrificans]